jgi:hypothetical protein
VPLMTNKIAYTDLDIRVPVTLRMQIPKSNLVNAKNKLGTTVTIGTATYTINIARWQLATYMCPEDQPDCISPTVGVVIIVEARRTTSEYVLIVSFRDFYVTGEAIFQVPLFKFGQEVDVVVDVTFRDSYVTVVANGREVISTDTLKRFSQIRRLEAYNVYVADTEVEVAGDAHLTYNLQVVSVADFTAMVVPLATVAVTIGIIAIVIRLIMGGLKGLKIPVPVPRPA